MEKFKIEITCNDCENDNVLAELHMNQGTGLLGLKCMYCGNDNNGMFYLDEDLSKIINVKGGA